MTAGHRLGTLHMGHPRHDRVSFRLGKVNERILQRGEIGLQLINCVAGKEPHIRGDLVIARTSSVQFLAGLAGDFSEPRLDIHMHIFERCAPHKAIVRDLL